MILQRFQLKQKKKNILNNPDIVKNKIKMADIIYFCGGDTIKLVNDLKEYGSEKAVREAGKMRLEGKEYIMQDGDICHFRFNVQEVFIYKLLFSQNKLQSLQMDFFLL